MQGTRRKKNDRSYDSKNQDDHSMQAQQFKITPSPTIFSRPCPEIFPYYLDSPEQFDKLAAIK
jgi:hypothetical protein